MSENKRYKISDVTVDYSQLTLSNEQESIKLPVKVFEFLKLFIEDENHIVERQYAIDEIWQGNEGVGKRGYINAMWQIRKTFNELGEDAEQLFITIPKVGYRLATPPQEIIEPQSSLPVTEHKSSPSSAIWISLCVLLVAFIVYLVWPQANESEDTTEVNVPPTMSRFTHFQGVEDQPAVSADGRYLAFQWTQERKKSNLYVRDLQDENAPLRLFSTGEFEESSPTWSPDGHRIAYARILNSGDCQIRIKQIITNRDKLIDSGCFYRPYLRMLDWSADGRYLLYPKRNGQQIALYRFDIKQQTLQQWTFPEDEFDDIYGAYSADQKKIAIVREKHQRFQLVIKEQGEESVILDNLDSIAGLSWNGKNSQQLVSNYVDQGKSFTYLIDLKEKSSKPLVQVSTGSNLTVSPDGETLYVAKHLSNEFISIRGLEDNQEIKRVSSSSRDLYGHYGRDNGYIMFMSNRSQQWDLWLKTDTGTENITKGMGTVTASSMSHDGRSYAVTIKAKDSAEHSLYLGKVSDRSLTRTDTQGLVPHYPSWSADNSKVFFSADKGDSTGLFALDIESMEIEQLSSTKEIYGVAGETGVLYVTREGQQGIWKFNLDSREFEQINETLRVTDFASFFYDNDSLYYVERSSDQDFVKQYRPDQEDEVVSQFPANTIRKFYGIGKAGPDSYLLTLNSTYDADIYSFPLISNTQN